MCTVRNQYGKLLDYESAVLFMDDEIREMVHREIAPCTEQEFFDAYCTAELKKTGEEFFLNTLNPVW